MSFDEIAILEGEGLNQFLDLAARMAERREDIYRVRVVVDGGTLKLKVGGGTWTPPMGKLDPECAAARKPDPLQEALKVERPGGRLLADLFPVDPPA